MLFFVIQVQYLRISSGNSRDEVFFQFQSQLEIKSLSNDESIPYAFSCNLRTKSEVQKGILHYHD